MVDILVRVPRSEVEHFWEPITSYEVAWWTLSRCPKRCGVGDVIWFQIEDQIVARAPVTFVDRDPRECESTGRVWRGVHLGWDGGTLEKLETPATGHKPDAGFSILRGCGHACSPVRLEIAEVRPEIAEVMSFSSSSPAPIERTSMEGCGVWLGRITDQMPSSM